MDIITLSRFIIPIHLGCKAEERASSQRVQIEVSIETDFSDVIKSGTLKDGIDYAEIRDDIKAIVAADEFDLLETLGDLILKKLFECKRILRAKVSIQKLDRWDDAVPGVIMDRSRQC